MTPLGEGFVLATANADKAGEIVDVLGEEWGIALAASPLTVGGVTVAFAVARAGRLDGLRGALRSPGAPPDVEETGATLEENARIKARSVAAAFGVPAVADDTGLFVDALLGAPGVRSARFAGEGARYEDNVARLLRDLEGVAPASRTARFATVMLARWPDGREVSATGEVEGVIAGAPRGTEGFGYDPVFVPRDGDGRTFGEMTAAEKHACSHRGRAVRALAVRLRRDRLHPQARVLLDAYERSGFRLEPGTTAEEARAVMASVLSAGEPPPVHAVEDRAVPGPAGPVPIRVYRPSERAGLPVVVWFHGGGWVVGDLDSHDPMLRLLAPDAGCLAVSVGYRLAPEHRFPAAVEDALAAYRWVRDHAAELGGDAARVAVGGDSAGGNLAAVTALLLREAGEPQPVLQVLVYPVTDHEFERPSMVENARGYFLEADGMRWFYDHYARDARDHADWRMSPLRAPSVDGLAPAFVVTAEFDPLRDQGEAYARRLVDAGVPVEVHRVDGMFHGFFGMHPVLEAARGAWDDAVAALRRAFGSGAGSERE